MTKDKQNIQAEDILSDEFLSEELQRGTLGNEVSREEELFLADQILRSVKFRPLAFAAEQKDILDRRIMESINQSKRRRKITWISSAAVLLVLFGVTSLFLNLNQSGLRDYAGLSAYSGSANTRIVLSGEKEIQIESQESKIEYSGSGTEIRIDASQKLEQQVSGANDFNTILVPFGKRSRITLSDNSVVWLNSGSKLIYPARFADEKREVYLDGEAMFEVSHDEKHPFFVLTRNLDVQVLGTVFNLCAYSDENTVSTVLESGSVELRYDNRVLLGAKKEMMVPGMLAVYNPLEESITQTKVNTRDYTSWKDGFVVLDKNSLGSIAKRLSRYYNVSIVFEDPKLSKETFSGYLDLKNSAVQVLEIISEIVDIEIVQKEQLISIRKKK